MQTAHHEESGVTGDASSNRDGFSAAAARSGRGKEGARVCSSHFSSSSPTFLLAEMEAVAPAGGGGPIQLPVELDQMGELFRNMPRESVAFFQVL